MSNIKNLITKKKHIFIIAEIGINHNGSIKTAKKLIDYAKDADADAVKFQTYDVNNLVSRNTKVANYQKKSGEKNQYKLLKKYQLSYNNFKSIKDYCDKKKILFLSTPFDNESAIFLNKLGVSLFKVSSADLKNLHLLTKIKSFKKKIILSTGMSNFFDLYKTLQYLNLPKSQIHILHCISEYPTALSDTNLGYLNKLKKLKYRFGISDHTLGNEFAIASIPMGSTIIEKHITLSKKMIGPDHQASLEVKDLCNFIKSIREINISINSSKRNITKGEKGNQSITKRRLFFKSDIKKNTVKRYNDLIPLRSDNKTILDVENMFKVIGCKSKKNYKARDSIKWKKILKS